MAIAMAEPLVRISKLISGFLTLTISKVISIFDEVNFEIISSLITSSK